MERDAPYMANRTLAVIRKLFNWCVERGVVETSPASGIKRPGREQSRDRVLAGDELRALWKACEAVGYPYGPFVQILLLTGQRRTEIATIRWDQVQDDVLTLPDTKNQTLHEVPLSVPVRKLLEDFPRHVGSYVFTTTGGERPISAYSKLKIAIDRANQEAVADDTGTPIGAWRFHDLRRTCTTGMARLQVAPHVIEQVLNHATGQTRAGVAGIYNRYGYLDEKCEALERWGERVKTIVSAQNIVELKA